MKVIKRSSSGYAQDPTKYFNFSRFQKDCGNFVLIEGAFEEASLWNQFGFSHKQLQEIKKKKIVRLEFEEPNKFFIGDKPWHYDKDFYKIFTLCPYTSEWLNKKYGTEKRIPIYFPFNEEFIPKKQDKLYDIIYTGHIVSNQVLNDIKTISKFNYRFASNSYDPLVTNKSVSYEEKMNLIAQSKITLVHNLLYPKKYHLINIWRIPDFRDNKAFELVPSRLHFWKIFDSKRIVVPQLKSRVFEAAFSRSLILCKRDQFNVIERYFIPDKEFVYFEEGTLEETINRILKNYPKYEKVAENAYNKAIKNYTVEKFVNTYLKHLV